MTKPLTLRVEQTSEISTVKRIGSWHISGTHKLGLGIWYQDQAYIDNVQYEVYIGIVVLY